MITWTSTDARRRADLITLDLCGRATAEDRAEIAALTERLRAEVRPMFDAARVLAEGALAAVEARDVGSGAAMPACRECGDFDPCEHDRGNGAGREETRG